MKENRCCNCDDTINEQKCQLCDKPCCKDCIITHYKSCEAIPHKIEIRYIEKPKKPKCLHCHRPLVAIADQRKNGEIFRNMKNIEFGDWENRKYHKKCIKEIRELKGIKARATEIKFKVSLCF